MRFQTILNRVEKYKSFVFDDVKFIKQGQQDCLEISIRERENSKPLCPICKKPGPGYDRQSARRYEFIPFWGILVFFVYASRRVNCKKHGVRVEYLPWAQGKSPLTKSYSWFLAHWAKRMSWSEVAMTFKSTWHHVFTSVKMAVDYGRKHQDTSGITAIGVDEMQWGKGHRYITVVYQLCGSMRRLIWVGEKRREKTLRDFFKWFGTEKSQQLEFVCSDMWRPYLNVIAERAGQALNILDRFHIMAHMSKAIDKVRAQEARQLKEQGYEPVLTKSRWLLLKKPENLKEQQASKLSDLLQYNLRTVRSYLMKEDFQDFWEYQSPYYAGKFLDQWCTRAMRSQIDPMKKIAKMLRKHKPLILNWFVARKQYSSGAVEGLNTKAKLATRKAYGFKHYKTLEIALYHQLGQLPELEFTHRFF